MRVLLRVLLPLIIALPLLSLTGCPAAAAPEQGQVAPILTTEQAHDDYTFAQPQVARVTHVSLDLALDFEAEEVVGTATLDVLAAPGAAEVVLDSDGLRVAGVTDGDGRALAWSMGDHVDGKGEPLTVALPTAGEGTAADGPRRVVIRYASAPDAQALQWLSPEQTAGKRHPYLISQGQEILNRTWIPTQDSPGIRQSWDARITAPAELKVVMSGILQGGAEDAGGGRTAYAFRMDHPVAPYLIAVAAGNLAFRDLGARSGVWTEPEMMDAAAAELIDTEAMIGAAEALYGAYRWGRYDMIVLPPSFPYGGMENPVMTFLTPTFIAGDRSLTGLVAHELAHSWSGNLVTYAGWRDGWLNEGVTSYIESRISELVFGPRRAAQEFALNVDSVERAVAKYGADSPMTTLRTPADLDPLESDSAIVYGKGALFLHTLEHTIGRERFDPWLRSWFDRHAFQPATSEMFLADLRENLVKGDAGTGDALLLDQWVYGTGIPDNVARPEPDVFATVDQATATYTAVGEIPSADWRGWTTAERLRFLQNLPQQRSAPQLAALDQALGLSSTGNTEVRFLWLKLALDNRYDPAIPQVAQFLSTVGRNKFVSPLYRAMSEQGEWGLAIARPLYQQTRGGYHPTTRGNVDRILGWDAAAAGN